MAVTDHGALDRSKRIDEELARLAIKPVVGRIKPSLRMRRKHLRDVGCRLPDRYRRRAVIHPRKGRDDQVVRSAETEIINSAFAPPSHSTRARRPWSRPHKLRAFPR